MLLFHFRLGATYGGFVGVDVFFVISGFLMTDIVARELTAGRFSYIGFMARRVKRIVPAMYVTVAVTLVAAASIDLPADLDALAAATRASVLFFANLHFDREAQYFAKVFAPSPLLHLWSLSVEMQFYVTLPLVTIALRRLRFPLFAAFAVGAVALLVLFLGVAAFRPVAAFYFTPLRAWEFLAGGAVALAAPPACTNRFRRIAAPLGLLAIAVAVVGPSQASEFRAWPVVFAAAGTTLVMWTGQAAPTATHAFLAWPPLRALGRISYSTYLVHWPLLILSEYWHVVPIDLETRIALLAASVGLGALGWRFVEEPFRRTHVLLRRPLATLGATLAGSGVLMAAGWAVPRAILPTRAQKLAHIKDDLFWWGDPPGKQCVSTENFKPISPARACVLGADVSPTVAIWSDSHGGHLGGPLAAHMSKSGTSLVMLVSGGCPPLIDREVAQLAKCKARNNAVLEHLRTTPAIRTIILAMSYDGYPDYTAAQIADGMTATIAALPDRRFVIIGPWPHPTFDVPSGMMRILLWKRPPAELSLPLAEHRAKRAATWRALNALASRANVHLVDPALSVCDDRKCPYTLGEFPLYLDDNHPSLWATERLAPRLFAALTFPQGK